VSAEAGYTVVDFDAAQVKRAMIACAREVVVVADSSKLGATAFASVCPLSAAHLLITDALAEESLDAALRTAGIEVVIAP
jgi:DeoR/GlpR family transcriptional regulator of sugar metabolism